MNRETIKHIIRGILFLVVQVLIFKRISSGNQWLWLYGDIFIYPIIILLLPIRMIRHYVIIIGFLLGLLIDMFYDTAGVHAFALTAMAYTRGIVLAYLEPRGGYQLTMSPTRHSMGINWLLVYTGICLLVHVFLYFTAEIFTFVYIGKILLKTFLTFLLSFITIMGYHLLFNPRK
ncbi:MAG TPA: hypothetical protein VFG10_13510 [Saprospiraceae bacterium]|nr:hypothetical protein [Saprospiraceae bacterium]